MPNTFFGLNTALSGLYASQTALNVTGNNISNQNTKGYSRQTAIQQASASIRVYQKYGSLGSGTEITKVEQIRDSYYDIKFRDNSKRLGEQNIKKYYSADIESQFNEMTVDGFTAAYDDFFNSMEDLKKDPSGFASRNAAINSAGTFLEYVNQIKTNLSNMQQEVNREVSSKVDEINTLASSIATLNKQINTIELTGAEASTLRDQRNLLVDQLSLIVPVTVSEEGYQSGGSDYKLNIGNEVLVNGYDYFSLQVVTRSELQNKTDISGLYDIQWSYGIPFNPIASGYEGELRGILEVRDGNNGVTDPLNPNSIPIKYKGVSFYIDKLNDFLESFTNEVNDIHSQGENLYGDKTTDIPLFVKSPIGIYSINKDILNDVRLMATNKANAQGVENQEIINELLDFKDSNSYQGNTAAEYIQSIIVEISIDSKRSQQLVQNYNNMESTIKNQRLSISGVDTDEEAMNLVRFQESYDLSAKMMQIMSEIYDRLILQTGV